MKFVFLLPHFLLLSGPDKLSALAGFVIYSLLGILLQRLYKAKFEGIVHPLLCSGISLALGCLFYIRWQNAQLFAAMESLPGMPAKRICGLAAALLSLLSLPGTDMLISAAEKLLLKKESRSGAVNETVFIGMSSAVLITLVSKCSPFYAFNDWVDPHTMFTVGKSILHGMVPYRDVFEQKGPLLLLLHSLGALVSYKSLLGIWILEIVTCFFFLFFSWRILKMCFGGKALPMIPVMMLAVFTSLSFEQGDSAEELCLPLLAYGLWTGYKSLRKEVLPKRSEWILIGVTSGCVLWMKYSMLGFYLGWFLAFFLFARKRNCLKDLLRGIGWIMAGVGMVTVPILVWFAWAGGFRKLFEVYFYENMFLYPKTADLYGNFALHRNLLNGLLNFIIFSTPIFIASVLGLFRSRRRDNKPLFRLLLYSFTGLFLTIYFSGRFYTYYSLIFGVFVPFGFCLIQDLAEKSVLSKLQSRNLSGTILAAVFCLCVIGAFLFSGNMRSLALKESDYPEFRAMELIESSGIEKPVLMNYQYLDMGVNTIAGMLPNQRFFCGFNLPLDEIAAEQNACLASGCTDFVLTFMLEVNSPNYVLLEKIPAYYNIGFFHPTYNLYQKK